MNDSENIVNRKYRDSIFKDLFSDKKYLFKLYQALHPEDKDTTIDDLHDSTIRNVFVNDYYNDLGFMVKDRLFILVEAQSTWNRNISVRAMLYLFFTYNRYIKDSQIDLFASSKVTLPSPELYVIYTGPFSEKIDKQLNLNDHFISSDNTYMSLKIKVIYNEDTNNIIGEYNSLIQEIGMQIANNGRNIQSVETAINNCINRNILKDYLLAKKSEVQKMAMYLYDEEEVEEEYRRLMRLKALEEGKAEGRAIGMAEGLADGLAEGRAKGKAEGRAEGRAEVLDQVNNLLNSCKSDSELIESLSKLVKNFEKEN